MNMLRDCVCFCNEVQFRLFTQGGHNAKQISPSERTYIMKRNPIGKPKFKVLFLL